MKKKKRYLSFSRMFSQENRSVRAHNAHDKGYVARNVIYRHG